MGKAFLFSWFTGLAGSLAVGFLAVGFLAVGFSADSFRGYIFLAIAFEYVFLKQIIKVNF
ncbi:MAG: hypothetical protein WCT03_08080 [Candidatus Obscuribacterales bacterium]|jgi:hypothetical protein